MPFIRLQTLSDSGFPHGRRYYTKSGYFESLEDQVIEMLIGALATISSRASEIELTHLGGAVRRVGPEETAFGSRDAPFVINILGNWSEPAEDAANVAWIRNLFAQLRPAMVYLNSMSGDEQDRVPEVYRKPWDRLRAVKTMQDAKNLFRLNQNIPPQQPAPRKFCSGIDDLPNRSYSIFFHHRRIDPMARHAICIPSPYQWNGLDMHCQSGYFCASLISPH